MRLQSADFKRLLTYFKVQYLLSAHGNLLLNSTYENIGTSFKKL